MGFAPPPFEAGGGRLFAHRYILVGQRDQLPLLAGGPTAKIGMVRLKGLQEYRSGLGCRFEIAPVDHESGDATDTVLRVANLLPNSFLRG